MSLTPRPGSLELDISNLVYFRIVLSQVTPKVKETASVTLEAVTGKQISSPNFAFCLGRMKAVDGQDVISRVIFPSQLYSSVAVIMYSPGTGTNISKVSLCLYKLLLIILPFILALFLLIKQLLLRKF